MNELPEEILCRILRLLPASRSKFSLLVINKKWNKAMLSPDAHALTGKEWQTSCDGLSDGLVKVLPQVDGSGAVRRVRVGGLNELYSLSGIRHNIFCDIWSDCSVLPNLTYLAVEVEVDGTHDTADGLDELFAAIAPQQLPLLERLRLSVQCLSDHDETTLAVVQIFLQKTLRQRFGHLKTFYLDLVGDWATLLDVNPPDECRVEVSIAMHDWSSETNGDAMIPDIPENLTKTMTKFEIECTFFRQFPVVMHLFSVSKCVALTRFNLLLTSDESSDESDDDTITRYVTLDGPYGASHLLQTIMVSQANGVCAGFVPDSNWNLTETDEWPYCYRLDRIYWPDL